MSDSSCRHFEDRIAEMALGVLEGRERAEVLAHLQRCPFCAQELVALGGVADRLVELTPVAEPPAGFETRVLNTLAAQASVGRQRRRWSRTAWVAVAAGVAALTAAGGWALGQHGPAETGIAGGDSSNIRTASFLAGGRPVGRVVAYDGPDPWVVMSVDSSLGDGTLRCELIERDGTTLSVGTFQLTYATSYWGAALTVAPSSVKGVELVDPAGTTVATAVFPSRTS